MRVSSGNKRKYELIVRIAILLILTLFVRAVVKQRIKIRYLKLRNFEVSQELYERREEKEEQSE